MTEKLAYSVSEVAKLLGISRPKAYELVKTEGFPMLRITEKRIVVPAEPFKQWLNERVEGR